MKKRIRKIISEVVIIAIILGGFIWVLSSFIHLGKVEFTDNAQVRQNIIPVNTRVQGFIKKVYFDDYQTVHRGDTLVVIEDSEFRLRLAQAQADYQNAMIGTSAMSTTISTTENNLHVSDAGIQEVKVQAENAYKDFQRYQSLLAENSVTQQQYDDVKTKYETLKARYEMLSKQKTSTSLMKQEQTQRLTQQQNAIGIAKASLELAELNLSYTVILAPCDGVTGKKSIHDGQLVQPGQNLLSVVDESNKWVVANYKESQTKHVAVGSKVEIKIDAVPNVVYKGVVSEISGATGAQYSLIPQDNSAGNFIKVEQLIPVKIRFEQSNNKDAMNRLRAGMNAECKIVY